LNIAPTLVNLALFAVPRLRRVTSPRQPAVNRCTTDSQSRLHDQQYKFMSMFYQPNVRLNRIR